MQKGIFGVASLPSEEAYAKAVCKCIHVPLTCLTSQALLVTLQEQGENADLGGSKLLTNTEHLLSKCQALC